MDDPEPMSSAIESYGLLPSMEAMGNAIVSMVDKLEAVSTSSPANTRAKYKLLPTNPGFLKTSYGVAPSSFCHRLEPRI